MSRGLYITGTGPRSGKSVVILGFMELLAGQAGNIGFFRPVAYPDARRDHAIQLISRVRKLKSAPESLCGCDYEEALEVIRGGHVPKLHSQILEKYKSLEAQCDFVVCAGTDYTGVNAALEFDFNVNIARNLGIPLLPVISGFARTPSEIVDSVNILAESLEAKNCDVFVIVVNHVDLKWMEESAFRLRNEVSEGVRAYVVPQHQLLEKPTVAEITRAFSGEVVYGEPEGLEREIHHYKVAAMELPQFLDELEDGTLVITTGDRSDIILGSLLADASGTYPQVAGLILYWRHETSSADKTTSGRAEEISGSTDICCRGYFSSTMTVSSLRGKIGPENKRKIAVARSLFESSVDLSDIRRAPHDQPLTPDNAAHV